MLWTSLSEKRVFRGRQAHIRNSGRSGPGTYFETIGKSQDNLILTDDQARILAVPPAWRGREAGRGVLSTMGG